MTPPLDWNTWLAPAQTVLPLIPGQPVFIYGAGTVGRDVLVLLRGLGHDVRGILDAKSSRTELAGVPVYRPDDPAFAAAERAATPVVLGLFNAFVDVPSVRARLQTLGWRQTIDFLELHAAHSVALGDRYWLTRRDYYGAHLDAIRATDVLWSDEESRRLYRQILRFRVTGNDAPLPPPDPAHQYFPADLPPWPQPLRMVDCGACDGDTLRQTRVLGLRLEALALFEPDPANFAQLAAEASALSETGVAALAWPCGVAARTAQLRFRADQGAASAFADAGDSLVACVALDDVLGGFSPNLVKMDIEGAETDALLGARRLIARSRPGLAVCVYHRPDDLWRIPQLLAGWALGYRFYLRLHQYRGFDLVLYARPAPV